MDATLPRLRQAVLVTRDLQATCRDLEGAFALRPPYADPGVGEFGLVNAVYEVGDCFLEVVAPAAPNTAAGRYLDRNGEGGYMLIFQVADSAAARHRIASCGARVVWQIDLDDISATHVHPKDAPGAIVSVDEARPARSWRWAGPRWIGGAPDDVEPGGVASVVVAVDDVDAAAQRWSALIGGTPSVRFVERPPDGAAGVTSVVLARPTSAGREVRVGTAFVRAE